MKEMKQKITTVLFDMDGTLLDTFEDMLVSINYAFEKYGFDRLTLEEISGYMGTGIWKYANTVLPEDLPQETREEIKTAFREHYINGNFDNHVRVYPGVFELVDSLYRRGFKLGVLSRKFDYGVKELSRKYFGERISVAVGGSRGAPIKPAPGCADSVLQQLGSTPAETVYIGDSEVDVETAGLTGMRCICVSWGCRDRNYLASHGALQIADTPDQLLQMLLADAL